MQEEFAKNSKLPTERELRAVLDSPETARLLALLRADGGGALQKAAQAVNRGDTEAAQRLLAPLLTDTDAAELLGRIEKRL